METYRLIAALQRDGLGKEEIAKELKVKRDWLEKVMESDSWKCWIRMSEGGAD